MKTTRTKNISYAALALALKEVASGDHGPVTPDQKAKIEEAVNALGQIAFEATK